MSKYDSIKTATDLIFEVRMHGLSLEQDDRNRAADILGNSGIKELADLANNAQCRNENGMTTGKPHTMETFYFIAFSVWGWEQATRFFNEHSNPVTKAAREIAAELSKLQAEHKTLKVQSKYNSDMCTRQQDELADLQTTMQEQAMEILTLKAKLYDLTAGA